MARPADVRIAVDLFDHPKWLRLGAAAGERAQLALIRLWAWAAKHRPRGALEGLRRPDVALVAGAPDLHGLADLLIATGWIDVVACEADAEGNADRNADSAAPASELLCLHDWREHQGWVFHAPDRSKLARKAAEARFKKGRKPAEPKNQPSRGHADRMRTVNGALADRMRTVSGPHAPSPTPTPAPAPTQEQEKERPSGPPSKGARGRREDRRRLEEGPPDPDADGQTWNAERVQDLALEAFAGRTGADPVADPQAAPPDWVTTVNVLASQGAPVHAVRQAVVALQGRLPQDARAAFTVLNDALRPWTRARTAPPPTGR